MQRWNQALFNGAQQSTNWNRKISLWTSGNTSLLWRWLSTDTGCPERLWISLLGDIQKLLGHGSGPPALVASAWAGVMDQMTKKDSIQTQQFYDSVKAERCVGQIKMFLKFPSLNISFETAGFSFFVWESFIAFTLCGESTRAEGHNWHL